MYDVNQERRTGEMWTRFEADRYVANCGMMGHFAKDWRRKGKGKGNGVDGGKGYAEGEGKTMKGAGKKDSGKSGGHTVLDVRSYRTQDGRVSLGESLASMRKVQKTEKIGGQPEEEEYGEVGGVYRRECGGNREIGDKFTEIREEQRDGFTKICGGQRDGLGDIRENRCDNVTSSISVLLKR